MKFHRLLCGILGLVLLLGTCTAEMNAENEPGENGHILSAGSWTAVETVTEQGESRIAYPVLHGGEDPALEALVNSRVLEDLCINAYLSRSAQLPAGYALQTEWSGILSGDVFSAVCSAFGPLETTRAEHAWSWSTVDLKTGEEIPLEALFTDPEEACTRLETYLEDVVGPELSGYLLNSEVTPLPEGFVLGRTGLILLYPVDQLSTLSDRAGAIHIGWNEIRDILNLDDDSVLSRLGIPEMITLTDHSAASVRDAVGSGTFPEIPVVLGQSMQELTDRYHLLIDPDGFDGGRMISLEGACFRDVYLLTDDLDDGFEHSVVQGIRMDRGCFFGLCIGETNRADWRGMLGQPDNTVDFDEEKAAEKRREAGSCDYYRIGDYQLQLYCDENETLVSITLTE